MKHWLIQSSGLRRSDEMTHGLIKGLEHSGGTWSDFGIIPFTPEITNWENFPDVDTYFIYCSTKGLRVLTEGKFKPTEIFVGASEEHAQKLLERCRRGIFYDDKRFDMSVYIKDLKRHLLNGHGDIMTVRELMGTSFKTPKFVKPARDLKIFSGTVIDANTKFSEYKNTIQYDIQFNSSMDENVIIADPVEILAEWRFFVVKSSIAAASQYQKFGKLVQSRHIPTHIMDAAKKMVGLYKPARCFTMDLALTKNLDLKVVEYNCINCSGLYDADVGALAFELRWA